MTDDSIFFIDDKLSMPAANLPIRCSVVKVAGGAVIISPTENLGQYKARIDTYGKVLAIVSPNLFHNLFLKDAKALYPEAPVWGPPSLEKKLKSMRVDRHFGQDHWPWMEELPFRPLEGMPLFKENAFYHKDSQTMICADLCFNLPAIDRFPDKLVFNLFGTNGRFAVSRLFKTMIWDKAKFKQSLPKVLDWDIRRPWRNQRSRLPRGYASAAAAHLRP
jgi:hypothetical protein